MSPEQSSEPESLRQRRARETRHEIEEAAFTLFELQGVEATTASEIARRAGVSERTFFRYMQTKEDAVLGIYDEFARALHTGFVRRDADVPLMQSVCTAYRDVLADVGDGTSALGSSLKRLLRLSTTEPTIARRIQERDRLADRRLVRRLEIQLGDTPDKTLLAHTIVAVAGALTRSAVETWMDDQAHGIEGDCVAVFDRVVALAHTHLPAISS
ncbi:MAG: TetR family transcriptional regulator [Thermomicrobiales bacterium]